jgi:hypothetical protein
MLSGSQRCALAAVALASLLAGCGSSFPSTHPTAQQSALAQASTPATQTVAPPPATTTTTPASTFAPPAATAVSGIAADNGANRALIDITFGTSGAMASLSNPTVDTCEAQVASLRSTVEHAVAVPVTVTARVTSTQAVAITVDLHALRAVTSKGAVGPLADVALWAQPSAETPKCSGTDTAIAGGTASWDAGSAQPGATQTWNAWIVVVGAITPADATGAATITRIVASPVVTIGGATVPYRYDLAQSKGIVQCSGSPAVNGSTSYIALDQTIAAASGCTPLTS